WTLVTGYLPSCLHLLIPSHRQIRNEICLLGKQKITCLPGKNGLTLHDRSSILFFMNKLSKDKRVQILTALCEGMSMRAVTRMVGCSINSVTKLLVDAGSAAAEFNERTMVNLKLRRIQCDEIWSFVGMKEKNVPADK